MQPLFLALIALVCSSASAAELSRDALDALAGRTVSSIAIEGNRITRDYVIYREVRTRIGHPLDAEILRADLQRLDNLDIFSSVRVRVEERGDEIDLTLRVRELPFAIPYVSSNVTDEDGWSFGPALKSVNMLGRDIFVAGYALFGGKTTFLLDLDYPWIAANHLSFHLDLSRIKRLNELDGFDEESIELSPALGLYIGESGRAAAGVSYFRFRSDRDGHTLTPDNTDQLLQVALRAGYDTRDNWGDPHAGWLNEFEVRRTGGPLPGDGDFWTTHMDLRRFQPVGTTHTLVAASLLSLQSGRVGIDLPEYMDYHLGGSNSLRGYDIRELGATLAGKNQWLGTLEYRVPLLPRREYDLLGMTSNIGLSAALFADGGMAWDRGEQWGRQRLRMGFGAGLRVLAPAIDMMRMDIGFDTEGHWKIHIASFSKMRAQRLRLR